MGLKRVCVEWGSIPSIYRPPFDLKFSFDLHFVCFPCTCAFASSSCASAQRRREKSDSIKLEEELPMTEVMFAILGEWWIDKATATWSNLRKGLILVSVVMEGSYQQSNDVAYEPAEDVLSSDTCVNGGEKGFEYGE
ncbi:hypothetical protein PIB30_076231 [Stylosanthes scabra]|uniref:Uncharacterized protein n=1 Tax=Stylosanthes scabra TaxID=79078 RepID=A0ABU6XNK5_9FABA|nr:hypothetical protein [Stylosanthes scabra]